MKKQADFTYRGEKRCKLTGHTVYGIGRDKESAKQDLKSNWKKHKDALSKGLFLQEVGRCHSPGFVNQEHKILGFIRIRNTQRTAPILARPSLAELIKAGRAMHGPLPQRVG